MYYTYVLKSHKFNRYYIGSTKDVNKRIKLHNLGKVQSTKAYLPWELVHVEEFSSRQLAYKHELHLKSYKGSESFKKLISIQ